METQQLLDSRSRRKYLEDAMRAYQDICIVNAIPVVLNFAPFIPILLSPVGLKMCSKNDPSDGLALSNGFGVSVIAVTGVFLALAIYKRCTKAQNDSVVSANLSIGICSTLMAINSIYLISLNLYCKSQ